MMRSLDQLGITHPVSGDRLTDSVQVDREDQMSVIPEVEVRGAPAVTSLVPLAHLTDRLAM